MTLGLICREFRLTWTEARQLRLWEVAALAEHLNDQAKQQQAAQRKQERATPKVR